MTGCWKDKKVQYWDSFWSKRQVNESACVRHLRKSTTMRSGCTNRERVVHGMLDPSLRKGMRQLEVWREQGEPRRHKAPDANKWPDTESRDKNAGNKAWGEDSGRSTWGGLDQNRLTVPPSRHTEALHLSTPVYCNSLQHSLIHSFSYIPRSCTITCTAGFSPQLSRKSNVTPNMNDKSGSVEVSNVEDMWNPDIVKVNESGMTQVGQIGSCASAQLR